MSLTSDVVDPPRIAKRVGIRFSWQSSSLLSVTRFLRISLGTTGNLSVFRISNGAVIGPDVSRAASPLARRPGMVRSDQRGAESDSGWLESEAGFQSPKTAHRRRSPAN